MKITPETPAYDPADNPLDQVLSEVVSKLSSRDQEDDDFTPPYHMMQQISGQISRAQGGQGPFRARFLDIATLAIAAILSIDRSQS